MLEKFPNQKFNIDLKDNNPSQVELWAELIKEHDAMDKVLTASFYQKNLIEVRRQLPDIATAFSLIESFKFYIANKFGRIKSSNFKGDAFEIPRRAGPFHLIRPKFIENAHKYEFKVYVWTINETKDMEHILSMGVDGIFTDDPIKLKAVLDKT